MIHASCGKMDPQPAAVLQSTSKALPLSGDEKRVLELHAQLRQLEQELALTQALHDYKPSSHDTQTLEHAQNALADSRALYVLRNQIVDGVLSANPVLEAVHDGINASPLEKDLAPLHQDLISASTALAQQSELLRSLNASIDTVEIQSHTLQAHNIALASELLELAEEAAKNKSQPITNPAQAAEIAELEKKLKISRQRFKVAKGTASAIIVGSGVDWARDGELRDVVLEKDED